MTDPPAGRRLASVVVAIGVGVVLVFVLRITISTSGSTGIAFLFMLPVGLAAWEFGIRVGLLVALACIALFALSLAIVATPNPVATLVIRGGALLATALVVAELRARTRLLDEAQYELELLRQALTPPTAPQLRALELGVAFVPAEHAVSGDFYLITSRPDGASVIVIGDVTGHGVEAARAATFARATFAAMVANFAEPDEIMALTNRTLTDRWADGSRFLTALCLIHEPSDEIIRWSVAGHPPPIRISNQEEMAAKPGLPLGIRASARYISNQLELPSRDGLLLYTDGLIEARRGRELFGEQRLRSALAAHCTEPPDVLVTNLKDSVAGFSGGHFADDVCIVALRATSNSG